MKVFILINNSYTPKLSAWEFSNIYKTKNIFKSKYQYYMLLCCAKIWICGLSHQLKLMQLQTIHLLYQINKPDTQTPRIRIGSESGDILKFLKYKNINISKPEISVYGGSGPLSAVSLHFSSKY